jgi:hypothetical protein
MYKMLPQEGPYTIVKSSIPEDQITPEILPAGGTVDAGIPAINVPTGALPQLAPAEVLPEAPIPGIPLIIE